MLEEILLSNVNALLCVVAAAILDAMLDKIADPIAYGRSVFRRWNIKFWLKTESWKNKYKTYPTGELIVKEYDKNNMRTYKPKLLGSTTLLVSLTDGWHLVKALKIWAIAFAIAFTLDFDGWQFYASAVCFKAVFSGVFTMFYDSIFRS